MPRIFRINSRPSIFPFYHDDIQGSCFIQFLLLLISMPFSLATKVSSGNLERSYRRAPKGAKEEDHGVAGAGICHLCLCGQGVDWEDLLLRFAL